MERTYRCRGQLLGITAMLGLLLLGTMAWNPLLAQPPSTSPGVSGSTVNDNDVIGYINQAIEAGWKDNNITPSKVATDHEFIRRVYLDIVGRIPSATPDPSIKGDSPTAKVERQGELQWSMSRPAATRRQDLVKYLLNEEPDYAKNWANLWSVWLLTRTSPPGIARDKLHGWLRDSFALNKPYDQLVRELLTATGKADENPATNFLLSHFGEMVPADERGERGQFEMVPATARITRLFLGVQTQCTQCHDHPFIDTRKQSQYWGINVFLRQCERKPASITMRRQDSKRDDYYELHDNHDANKDAGVFFEKRNGLLLRTSATYLNGDKPDLNSSVNRREMLAQYVLKDDFFARAIVNRTWAHFMGRGFTAVVDDFGEGEHNPPSHPELLDRLAQDFKKSKFDLRRLITWITLSKPYQLSSIANDTNKKSDADPFFSRMLLKSMTPEQLVDSIFVATNAEKTKATATDSRRMYEEWLKDFTLNFGDDEGNEATFNGTVVQALLLMNGAKLNDAISPKKDTQQKGTIFRAAKMSTGAVDYLFKQALSRPPTSQESSLAAKMPHADVLWALINSNEFILNH